jgi:hypothetical protein
MPYDIKPNYRECNGYAVVGPDGDILGCHSTREEAKKIWQGSAFDRNVDKKRNS